MKRFRWFVGLIALAVVPLLVFVGAVGAQRFSSHVDETETVQGSLFSSGRSIEVRGIVKGDIFCAGQTVVIDATVEGDVICAGQDVTIRGTVDGDVRVAGQTVSVDSTISRNITVVAQNLSLDASATVGRDAVLTGDVLNVKGRIGRDAVVGGSTVTMNGIVGRHVRFDGQQLRLKSDAKIAGDLTYISDRKLTQDEGAVVQGATNQQARQRQDHTGFASFNVGMFLYLVIALLCISMVAIALFPQAIHAVSNVAVQNLAKVILVGFLGGLAVPMLVMALLFTIVGMPLALLVVLAWLMLAAASGPVAGYYLGRIILRRSTNALLIMAVGSLVLLTLYFVPIIGFLALILAYWVGSGAILVALKRHWPRPVYNVS